jgi:hypothetical protein
MHLSKEKTSITLPLSVLLYFAKEIRLHGEAAGSERRDEDGLQSLISALKRSAARTLFKI